MDEISPIDYQEESQEDLIVSISHTNKRVCEKNGNTSSFKLENLLKCLNGISNPGYPEGLATIAFRIVKQSPFQLYNEETGALFFSNRCSTLGIMSKSEVKRLKLHIEQVKTKPMKAREGLISLAADLDIKNNSRVNAVESIEDDDQINF